MKKGQKVILPLFLFPNIVCEITCLGILVGLDLNRLTLLNHNRMTNYFIHAS